MTDEQNPPAAGYEDLFDTGPAKPAQQEGGAAPPVQVEAAPVQQVDAAPVQVDATPVQVDAAPVQVDATPVQVDATPVQVDATPVQVEASPVETPPPAADAPAPGGGMDEALAEFEADLAGDIGPDWSGAQEAPQGAAAAPGVPAPDPRLEALKRALEAKGFTPERIADVLRMMERKPLPEKFNQPEPAGAPPDEPVVEFEADAPVTEAGSPFDTAPVEAPAPEEPPVEAEGGKKKMKQVDPEMLAKLMAEQEAEEAAAAQEQQQQQQQQPAHDPAQQGTPAQQQGYTQTSCYNCGGPVDVPPERPVTVVCGGCGTQGVIN